MSGSYKKGDKVRVLATSYIPGTYHNHKDFSPVIYNVCDNSMWMSKYVPEYTVSYQGSYITIPEYSIYGKIK